MSAEEWYEKNRDKYYVGINLKIVWMLKEYAAYVLSVQQPPIDVEEAAMAYIKSKDGYVQPLECIKWGYNLAMQNKQKEADINLLKWMHENTIDNSFRPFCFLVNGTPTTIEDVYALYQQNKK
jgi:hypothetical protein